VPTPGASRSRRASSGHSGTQSPAELIERRADVLINVRVDTDRDADFAILHIAPV
jgi:hypothetical protein